MSSRFQLLCFSICIALNVSANDKLDIHDENIDKQLYQIDYIIFEHLNTDDHILRYEDIPYPEFKTKQFSYLTDNANPISPYQFPLLDQEKWVLETALKQLKRSRLVAVLDSGAWQQHLSSDSLPAPLKIEKAVSHGRQLFGEIQLKKSRYTHAALKLYLTKSITVPFKNISDWFIDKNTRWRLIDLLTPLNDLVLASKIGTNKIYTDIIYLDESRRIKEGEIHYIDHPILSAIITIKEVPQANHLDFM